MDKKEFDINNAVLLGTAYYPEDWDEAEQDRDIAMMQKAGIKIARMAEFSWAKTEPREGEFHFEWLHRVIDKLWAAGIYTMLGTPTATPPNWVEELDPDMMMLDESSRRYTHGGRRHNCSNNPTYRKYSARIVERMAKEFGADKRVVAWQLDNEIYTYDSNCYCEHCRREFAKYLERKYKTVENLNKRWNLNLFSQWYDSFEQVPMPRGYVWHNPHLRYEWRCFMGESHTGFIAMQAEILHRFTEAPVGTDMMQAYGVPYEEIAKHVDMIQFNHYDDHTNQIKAAFWFDYLRGFKDIPFWVTETSTCWNGGTTTPNEYRPEGFCRANSWLPIVLGGGANMYWLWRQHWAGHELMHGAVLYSSGRPMHMFHEIQRTAEEFEKAEEFLSATRVKTDTAMIVSSKSRLLTECQHIAETGDSKGDGLLRFYRYVNESGIRTDVIPAGRDLSEYRLVFAPYLTTLEEDNLPVRLRKWVENGGVLVAGPLTDMRDEVGAKYTDRELGMLEDFTGAEMVYQIPDHSGLTLCEWADGAEYKALHYLQLFDIPKDAEPLVTVKSGFSSLIGKTLIFKKKIGRGAVLMIGALPDDGSAERLMNEAIALSGISVFKTEGDVVAARREGDSRKGIAVQEISGKSGKIYIEGTATDILTGEKCSGDTRLEPFGTRILEIG